jgi:cytochrome c oxidase cbb3-type subunit 3
MGWRGARARRSFDARARLPLRGRSREDAHDDAGLVVVRDRVVVLNIVGCGWLLWWTAKRRPGDPKPEDTSHYWGRRHHRVQQAAAEVVDQPVLDHHRLRDRYLLWYPGLGTFAGYGKWPRKGTRPAQGRNARAGRDVRAVSRQVDRRARGNPERAAGPLDLQQHLRDLPRLLAQGAIGYPNLSDDIWHWGGSPTACCRPCSTAAKA